MSESVGVGSGHPISLANVPQPPEDEAGVKAVKEVAGRGFSEVDSVSRLNNMDVPKSRLDKNKITLPLPKLTTSNVTYDVIDEVDGSLKDVNAFKELGKVFSQSKGDVGEGKLTAHEQVLSKKIQDNIATIGKPESQPVSELSSVDIKRLEAIEPKQLTKLVGDVENIMMYVGAIKSGPKELLGEIKTAALKAMNAVLTGNVEDAAVWLMEVQSKLQDTRIKFDVESLNITKLEQKQGLAKRLASLTTQMEKLRDAKNLSLFVKIFSYVMTVLAYVTAVLTIITPGAQAAGAVMLAAAIMMTAALVIEETEMIKDPEIAFAFQIAVAVITCIMTVGAGVSVAVGSGASKVVGEAVKESTKAAVKAASAAATKAAVIEVAKGAGKETVIAAAKAAALNAAKATAMEVAKKSVTASMKPATKALIENAAKTAAEAVAKKVATSVATAAIKSAATSVGKNVAKSVVKNAGHLSKRAIASIAKNAVKQTAMQAKMGSLFKIVQYTRYATDFITASSMIAQGGLMVGTTLTKKEAADAGVDAKEALADLAKLQYFMDQLMDSLKVIYEQLTAGQEIASDTLKSALNTKSSIISHI
ncbi:MAG: type III secretion system translocon subunit SctE [Endozoicomonadaceae bacterium]|nr:type III secretion system translocon subunit SctE [Endozoicomonadaceae bacterium]